MGRTSLRDRCTKGLFTVVAGNTTTSTVIWSPTGRLLFREWHLTKDVARQAGRLLQDALNRFEVSQVLLSGVVPAVVDALARALESSTVNRQPPLLLRFRRNLPCPLLIRPRPAAKVGDDRLSGALGALAIDPRVPWVVVDAGTALTVNAVRPPDQRGKAKRPARGALGVFEGGLIIPGEQLALSALGGGTAQLPALNPMAARRVAPVWGRSTEEAIRSGVRRAQIAAVVGLVRAQADVLGARTRVVLTGGGAEVFWPVFRVELRSRKPVRVPDLVHRGLRFALDTASEAGRRKP